MPRRFPVWRLAIVPRRHRDPVHRARLAARGARRPAAANSHDAASLADDGRAGAPARRSAGDRAACAACRRVSPRPSSARLCVAPRPPRFDWLTQPARMLDRVRRRDLGMASPGDLSARAPLRRMARGRARMLLHDGADVLVPGHPAVAERRAMAAMGDDSVSAARRRAEHDPRRALHVFRIALIYPYYASGAASRRLHSAWRPDCRRRYHVGARLDLLPGARRAHHVSDARAAKPVAPLCARKLFSAPSRG